MTRIQYPASSIQNPASSVAFVTLGCKVNQYETQVMREALKRRGFRVVAPDDAADVYVINTCTVTGISDRKSRQMIRRAVALNPDAVVVVTGCYAERSPDEIRDIPGVDLVLSNREKLFIGEYLGEFEGGIRLNPSITPILAFPHQGGRDLSVDGKIPLNPPLRKGDFADEAFLALPESKMKITAEAQRTQSSAKEEGGNGQGAEGEGQRTKTGEQEALSPVSYALGSLPSLVCLCDLRASAVRNSAVSSSVEMGRNEPDSFSHPPITSFDSQTRAMVKIEDGCDSFCSYCIVPHVRGGTIRSRPVDGIVREVRSLAGNGYKEVVLTGVHLGAYGRELTDGTGLSHVLRAIHDVDGIARIRLSSIEPMDVSSELIKEMASLPKCAHHFHVSLQSGSDKILRLMRRGYTSAEFEDVVKRIRWAIPDVGISTDVMVGFPGETERDFRDTCDLIARVKFSRLHAFRYSPREGTPAANFPDQVQDIVASRRGREVRALGDGLAQEFRSRMLGQEADVLVEDSREGESKILAGFTGNYVRVLVADAPDELAGRMIRVKLVDMENDYLVGILV